MKYLLLTLALLSAGGCASRRGTTMVISYDELGPQAAAFELIGYEWYQWEHGDHHGDYTIYVVVFDGISLAEVKRRYPVNERAKLDYRYLSLTEALNYIDDHRHDLLPHLQVTRTKLTSYFYHQK